MKKFILALIGAVMVVTVTAGTATAAESPKPHPFSAYEKFKSLGGKNIDPKLTKYASNTSLGREARKRVDYTDTCLRLDRRTIVCYIGTVKLKYAGTAKRKPNKNSTQVFVRSSIKKDRFHVYRFVAK